MHILIIIPYSLKLMRITINGHIWIEAGNINPENRINTDAQPVIYNEKAYIVTSTNRYWHNSSRGNVLELRNAYGKKLKEVGTNEVESYPMEYWGDIERNGQQIPEKIKTLISDMKKIWG